MRLLILLCMLGCGGRVATKPTPTPPARQQPRTAAELHVVVAAKTIAMNGVAISGRPKVADFTAIYGQPDRTWDSGGANRIHTWDKLGLLVYEPYDVDGSTGDGRCISATFPFKAMSTSFSPKTLFAGTIVMDGKAFTPALSLEAVLGWPGATQPYTKQSIVFDRDEFHVFTIEETEGKGLDLVEVSFWQKREAKPREERRPASPRITAIDDDDCKNGDVPHCTNRALVYQSGVDGRRSFERAFELVRISCAGGDVFGCLMIGNMYDAGKGTIANKAEAKTAWKRACTLGYKPACELK